MKYQKRLSLVLISVAVAFGFSSVDRPQLAFVIADPSTLKELGISTLHEEYGAALARVTEQDELRISRLSHEKKRCGGYEKLGPTPALLKADYAELFKNLRPKQAFASVKPISSANSVVVSALNQVSENELKSNVAWLSGFQTRAAKGARPNEHVLQLKARMEQLIQATGRTDASVDLISHRGTQQKSLRLAIRGSSRPGEILVMGAHLDSINQSFFGSKLAPGADDDASGSSNLIEAARVLLSQAPIQRSVEFFWYAAEEIGLVGSGEIAQDYRSQGRDVVGVVQFDMTMFPGDGAMVLASMTDFTSPFMRDLFENINDIYLKVRIVNSQCGYGCSDHASWTRQGYPALMPSEASMRRMNSNLHTEDDVIDTTSSFKHSAVFSKLAVAMAMELGNSAWRE